MSPKSTECPFHRQLIRIVEALLELGYRGVPKKGLHKLLNKVESELGKSKRLLKKQENKE